MDSRITMNIIILQSISSNEAMCILKIQLMFRIARLKTISSRQKCLMDYILSTLKRTKQEKSYKEFVWNVEQDCFLNPVPSR